jgi:hypothetical protein
VNILSEICESGSNEGGVLRKTAGDLSRLEDDEPEMERGVLKTDDFPVVNPEDLSKSVSLGEVSPEQRQVCGKSPPNLSKSMAAPVPSELEVGKMPDKLRVATILSDDDPELPSEPPAPPPPPSAESAPLLPPAAPPSPEVQSAVPTAAPEKKAVASRSERERGPVSIAGIVKGLSRNKERDVDVKKVALWRKQNPEADMPREIVDRWLKFHSKEPVPKEWKRLSQ